MQKIVHMCIDIRGLMSKAKSQLRNLIRDENQEYLAPDAAWHALADELAKGRRVLPFGAPCEGFSYETGCPGHEVPTPTLGEIAAAAAKAPEECGEHCACPCHTDVEDPGPEHLPTCAFADPDFPDYLARAE